MHILDNKKYRHELKFELNAKYAEILKYKFSLIMESEKKEYTVNGKYYVRSLYFDDVYNTAYYEKIDGLEKRKKYRIRLYNLDKSYIILELKGKDGNLTYKKSDRITVNEYYDLINQNYDKINIDDRRVLSEFINKSKSNNLIPSIIVDYNRVVYTYPIEDVRITFDTDISSGRFDYNLFSKEILLYDVLEKNKVIMEVKYNNFLPKIVNDLIKTVPSSRIAMSKFAMCKEKKEL